MRTLLGWLRPQQVSRSLFPILKPKSRLPQYLKLNQTRRYAHAYEGPEKRKNKIGEQVLIYQVSTLKTLFVGLMKATTVVVFFGNLFLVVPRLYLFRTSEQQAWIAPAAALLGAVPLVYVWWASAPFVISANLKNVPLSARRSLDHLFRWAEKLPHDTDIEFKTFKWYGYVRRSSVPLGDLRKAKPRLDIGNLERSLSPAEKQQRLWQREVPRLFYVGKERKESLRTVMWKKISSQIKPSS